MNKSFYCGYCGAEIQSENKEFLEVVACKCGHKNFICNENVERTNFETKENSSLIFNKHNSKEELMAQLSKLYPIEQSIIKRYFGILTEEDYIEGKSIFMNIDEIAKELNVSVEFANAVLKSAIRKLAEIRKM